MIKLMINFRVFSTGLDEIILDLVMQAVQQVLQTTCYDWNIVEKYSGNQFYTVIICSYENCLSYKQFIAVPVLCSIKNCLPYLVNSF